MSDGTNTLKRSLSDSSELPAKRVRHLSAAEKEDMVEKLAVTFPAIEKKVLYLALRHYYFDADRLLAQHGLGKVDFVAIEKRYLLEEMAVVKERLDQLCPQEAAAAPEDAVNDDNAAILAQGGQLVPVDLQSDEGLDVRNCFHQGDARSHQIFDLVSIERIENPRLQMHYALSQNAIAHASGNKTNELRLFHGSSAVALGAIARNGFDLRVSSFKGVAGLGLYFSKYPRTSLAYIKDCSRDAMKILLCRVELGLATSLDDLLAAFPHASPSNPIRRPHARSPQDAKPFDSVAGFLRKDPNHPIHIIYDHYQALPEYVITFAIQRDRVTWTEAPTEVIRCTDPRYRQQWMITRNHLRFLERSLAYAPNKTMPDYPTLERLHLLLTQDPADPTSLHHTQGYTLQSLQQVVRHYNTLCSSCPVLFLPETAVVPVAADSQIK